MQYQFRARLMGRGLSLIVALGIILSLFAGAAPKSFQAPALARPGEAALDATNEVLGIVSRLRHLSVLHPVKSGMKTHDEIEQSVIRDLDENTTPAEFDATSKTLLKLGLIPKGFRLRDYVVKLLREQVAGFYEPKTKEFYLAAWLPISEQKSVMAHELTHALQDQHFNLQRFERWPKGDSDAEMAAHALVEGEATVVMFEYAAEQEGVHLDVTALSSLTDRMLEQDDTSDSSKYPVLSQAPLVLRENLQFPYVYGVGFVQQVLKNKSWQTLDLCYDKLPASSQQIMHPAKFLDRDDPVKIKIGDLQPALGQDWKRADEDVNGEFGYMVLLSEFIGKRKASAAAEGWSGDRYVLYENKRTGDVILAQYTTWHSASDAKRFFDAYLERTEKRYPHAQPPAAAAENVVYETGEGLASIELRGNDVVTIEGPGNRAQLKKLSELVWQSKKTPR
ncbi:MAG TPA: hypothetical protein VN345_05450 [Blastocatellia bacterium]|nr:hypothetical protein [Blastocatellia bacterium]